MQTGAEPAAVRKIAEFKKWADVAPKDAPGTPATFLAEGKYYSTSSAWTFTHDGTKFWVGLIDIPEHPSYRYCSLKAYNLDSKAAHSGFTSGSPDVAAPEIGRSPAAINYDFPDYHGTATYTLSGTPNKVLHTISFLPRKLLSK
jgi:hypothetical protein